MAFKKKNDSLIDLFYLRTAVGDYMVVILKDSVIGGAGMTVEIDESMFGNEIVIRFH